MTESQPTSSREGVGQTRQPPVRLTAELPDRPSPRARGTGHSGLRDERMRSTLPPGGLSATSQYIGHTDIWRKDLGPRKEWLPMERAPPSSVAPLDFAD